MTSIQARSDIHGATRFLQGGGSSRVQTGWISFLEKLIEKVENGARQFRVGIRVPHSAQPCSRRGNESLRSDVTKPRPIPRRPLLAASVTKPVSRRAVWFNRTLLNDELLPVVDHIFRQRVADGSYWYDYVSGEWGIEGRGRSGKIRHGLDLGGPLMPNASNGKTGIFVNGREITSWETIRLRWTAAVPSGRYWMDQNGNFGPENGGSIGNIRSMTTNKAQAA